MLRRACQASASATRALVGFRHEFAPTAQRAAASALLARNEAADANGAQEGAAWRTGAGLLAVSAAAAALLTNRSECEASPNAKEEQQAGGVSLISPEKRKMVFFNYERSLRQRSSPDKIFEYFSSEVRNGCAYMTPVDLMRAVVPVFQPFGSKSLRCGNLPGESKEAIATSNVRSPLFEKFIPDPFGLISYGEYIFFVTLLSIPYKDIRAAFLMFDHDGSGALDAEEFKSMMRVLRQRTRHGNAAGDKLRHGLKVDGTVDGAGCSSTFFGRNGTGLLPMAKFEAWIRELHEEMVRLEFHHYDSHQRKGKLDARDFALSLIAASEPKRVAAYLDRIQSLPPNLPLITLNEFMDFSRLRWRLDELKAAVSFYGEASGKLTPELFKLAVQRVCGIKLSDAVVKVVFHIFDDNGDGFLSDDEFFAAYERHMSAGSTKGVDSVGALMACCSDCYHAFHDR